MYASRACSPLWKPALPKNLVFILDGQDELPPLGSDFQHSPLKSWGCPLIPTLATLYLWVHQWNPNNAQTTTTLTTIS